MFQFLKSLEFFIPYRILSLNYIYFMFLERPDYYEYDFYIETSFIDKLVMVSKEDSGTKKKQWWDLDRTQLSNIQNIAYKLIGPGGV